MLLLQSLEQGNGAQGQEVLSLLVLMLVHLVHLLVLVHLVHPLEPRLELVPWLLHLLVQHLELVHLPSLE